MPALSSTSRGRLLDPSERFSEILFGLIMVLSFTGSMSAAMAGREEVRTMLFGAIGCNLAWGIVDGVMYLVTALTGRSRALVVLNAIRNAPDPEHGRRIIEEELPDGFVRALGAEDLEAVRLRMTRHPEPPAGIYLTRNDFLAAAAVCAVVFLSTFPVVIPFIVMRDAIPALRVSNLIAVALLFVIGFSLGRYAGFRPLRMGLSMVGLGGVLVAITIALGG
jgi:hypothetical protein